MNKRNKTKTMTENKKKKHNSDCEETYEQEQYNQCGDSLTTTQ